MARIPGKYAYPIIGGLSAMCVGSVAHSLHVNSAEVTQAALVERRVAAAKGCGAELTELDRSLGDFGLNARFAIEGGDRECLSSELNSLPLVSPVAGCWFSSELDESNMTFQVKVDCSS